MVMAGATALAVFFAVVPLRFVLMGLVAFVFLMGVRGDRQNNQGNRRLKEWWDSIPIVPVRIIKEAP